MDSLVLFIVFVKYVVIFMDKQALETFHRFLWEEINVYSELTVWFDETTEPPTGPFNAHVQNNQQFDQCRR